MCLRVSFNGYTLLNAILNTLLFASRLAPIKAFLTHSSRSNLSVPHQLLLHPDRRSGVIQPRTVSMVEGMPPWQREGPNQYLVGWTFRSCLLLRLDLPVQKNSSKAGIHLYFLGEMKQYAVYLISLHARCPTG